MRRYIALIRQEHGSFSVEFPDLPGCVSAGETLDEAINRASIALSFYAADMIGSGLSLPDPTPSDAILEATEARGATAVLVALYPPKGQQVRAHISADEHFLRRIDAAAAERGITRSAFLMQAAHNLMRPGPAPKADLARAVDVLIATGGRPVDVIKEVIARERRAAARTDASSAEAQIIRMPDRHGDDPLSRIPGAAAASEALTTIEQEILRRVLAGEESRTLAGSLGIELSELERLLDEALEKIAEKTSS